MRYNYDSFAPSLSSMDDRDCNLYGITVCMSTIIYTITLLPLSVYRKIPMRSPGFISDIQFCNLVLGGVINGGRAYIWRGELISSMKKCFIMS